MSYSEKIKIEPVEHDVLGFGPVYQWTVEYEGMKASGRATSVPRAWRAIKKAIRQRRKFIDQLITRAEQ